MDLDALSAWLSAQGIHPLIGGFVAGVVAMLLVRMSMSATRDATPDDSKSSIRASAGMLNSTLRSEIRTLGTQISVNNNGQDITLPEDVSREIFTHLANNRKIDAIKVLREATGMDLLAAKTLVEVLEKHRT